MESVMMKMMKMMIAVLMALLVSINAAPVNNTTIISDYSYCNESSGLPLSNSLHSLYDDLDNTLDALGEVCLSYDAINCTVEEIPQFTIPEDRDSQNDAINGQLEVFKGQLLILDAACTAEESKAARGISSLLKVCETLYCTLKPFSWRIVDYLISEMCGCGSNCYYVPGNFINDSVNANASIEQLPSLFYNTVNFIDVLISDIGRKRDSDTSQ